eukprot:7104849-Prymnesium_polylepis.2
MYAEPAARSLSKSPSCTEVTSYSGTAPFTNPSMAVLLRVHSMLCLEMAIVSESEVRYGTDAECDSISATAKPAV